MSRWVSPSLNLVLSTLMSSCPKSHEESVWQQVRGSLLSRLAFEKIYESCGRQGIYLSVLSRAHAHMHTLLLFSEAVVRQRLTEDPAFSLLTARNLASAFLIGPLSHTMMVDLEIISQVKLIAYRKWTIGTMCYPKPEKVPPCWNLMMIGLDRLKLLASLNNEKITKTWTPSTFWPCHFS